MPWPAFLVAAAGSTVTRTLVIRGGTAVIVYVTASGVIQQFYPDQTEQIEAFEAALKEVGGTIVEGVENATLSIIKGLGGAIVDGVDSAFDAIRDKLRGKEPDVIAGFTVGAIAILAGVFLYHSVKNAKDAL